MKDEGEGLGLGLVLAIWRFFVVGLLGWLVGWLVWNQEPR